MITSLRLYLESQQSGRPKSSRSKDEELELAKMSPIYQNTQYQGWKITVAVHAGAQAYDRRPDFEFDKWKELHRRAINALPKNARGDFLVFSKSMEQGYIFGANARSKTINIITVLPKGAKFPKPGTELILVESLINIDELICLEVE